MEQSIRVTSSASLRGAPWSLAVGMHAALAAMILAFPLTKPPAPGEPAMVMELVAWTPPPEPMAAPAAAAPSPAPEAAPKAAAPKAATPHPAAPQAARSAPRAHSSAAAIPSPAPAPAPAATPPADGSMSDAAALTASAPAATGPVAPVHEAYLPPNGDAAYLSNPRPAYPPLAQKRGWEGVVTLFVAVDENGQPQEVKVKETSGYPVLDRCAVEAVQRWRFVPAKRGGRAVAANVEVPIRFGLEERSTG